MQGSCDPVRVSMARGWRCIKPSLASALLRLARVCVCAVHPFILLVPCASLHPIYNPSWYSFYVMFYYDRFPFFVTFFALFCFYPLIRACVDVPPPIFSCPADHVSYWQPRIVLGCC